SVARALHYAHQNGVIHRDIKPANIMIDQEGKPHIGDFGLAKRTDVDEGLTMSGQVMGTPGYMSPEQANGEAAQMSTATDVYSLGAVLYEVLTSQPPFKSGSLVETLRKVVDQPPERPSKMNPEVDRDLETICLRCLEKEPNKRYDSAGAVADELDRWLTNEPILARRISLLERLYKWAARRPAMAALSCALLLSLAIGASFVTWKWREAEYHRTEVETQKNKREEYLYAAHMNLVQQAWENGMTKEARRLLDIHLPQDQETDLRTFEWHYYDGLIKSVDRSMVLNYGAIVSAVEVSPSGDELAASGDDGQIQIWDLNGKKHFQSVPTNGSEVDWLEYSADGNSLLACERNGSLQLFQKQDGRFQRELLLRTDKFPARLSPNGAWLLAHTREKGLLLWDLEDLSSEPRELSLEGTLSDVQWLGDDERFITGTEEGAIQLWNVNSSKVMKELLDFSEPIQSFAISKDGNSFAVVTNNHLAIYGLTPSDEMVSERKSIGTMQDQVRYLFALENDDLFACIGRHSLSVWSFSTGERLALINDPDAYSASVESSPGGQQIATLGKGNSVHLWDSRSGDKLGSIKGHDNVVYGFDFADSGVIATCSRDESIRITLAADVGRELTIPAHNNWIWSANFSPESQFIASASADGKVKLWEVPTGELVSELTEHHRSVQFVLFSPDGHLLASASRDHKVLLFEVESGELVGTLEGHTGPVNSLSFSSDGRYLASGSDDGSVLIWDVAEREVHCRTALQHGAVWAVAFSPNDYSLVFGGTNQETLQWDLATDSPPERIHKHSDNVTSLIFSQSGDRLSATDAKGIVTIFDFKTRQLTQQFTGHSGDVMSTSFSPDGNTLVSGSSDGKVRVWNLRTGERTLEWPVHKEHIHCVRFSPDGKRVASASWDGSIKIWSIAPDTTSK
ncbi:MAG: serine/threonine-protein kinase, partial [Planctomycetota bacterium]